MYSHNNIDLLTMQQKSIILEKTTKTNMARNASDNHLPVQTATGEGEIVQLLLQRKDCKKLLRGDTIEFMHTKNLFSVCIQVKPSHLKSPDWITLGDDKTTYTLNKEPYDLVVDLSLFELRSRFTPSIIGTFLKTKGCDSIKIIFPS